MHYRRRCRMVAPCCGEVFWCRHCHNELKTADEWVRPRARRHTRSCSLNHPQNLALGCRAGKKPKTLKTLKPEPSPWALRACRTRPSGTSWTARRCVSWSARCAACGRPPGWRARGAAWRSARTRACAAASSTTTCASSSSTATRAASAAWAAAPTSSTAPPAAAATRPRWRRAPGARAALWSQCLSACAVRARSRVVELALQEPCSRSTLLGGSWFHRKPEHLHFS